MKGLGKPLWTKITRFETLRPQSTSQLAAAHVPTQPAISGGHRMTIVRHVFLSSLTLTFLLVACQSGAAQVLTGSSSKSGAPGGAPQMHQDSAVKQTAWPSIPLPKITMPKISMPDMSAITAPIKSGYSKVATGTKNAWEGTKEMFTFGKGDSAAQPAARTSSQQKQGFWGKMFSSEPAKPDGPQTVGEWMSQPRLDP